MPKHAITIPARRAGRRVRWMFEVSADLGEGVVHAKTSKKRTRAKRATKKPLRARSSQRTPAVSVGLAPTSGRSQVSQSASGTTRSEMVFVAVVGAIVVGALALTAYPALHVGSVAGNAPPRAVAPPVHAAAPPVAAVASGNVSRTSVEEPEDTPVKSTRSSPKVPFRWPPPGMKSDSGAARTETDALGRTVDAPAVASTITPDAGSQPVTTMSGCLEATVDGGEFRLTEIESDDAPKARSWRSGFLKKRSAPVDLVEVSDRAGLRKYVGHRVTASGVLTGRELRVRTFQSAGAACE